MLPEAESRLSQIVASTEQITATQTDEFKTWRDQRRFSHTDFSIEQLAAIVRENKLSVTVIIPGKEVASKIGGVITQTVGQLVEAKVVTRVVVVDAASKDGTAQVAAALDAQVIQQFGLSRGKGDALWRGLLATTGDIVAFLDGDTADPVPAHLLGILGPFIVFDDISMVRECFDRPFKSASRDIRPHGGGRVTECLARPLLNTHWPSLSGFRQPLAGEFAARRQLLKRLSLLVGYGVEIGALVDSYNLVGINGLGK
jgi:glucosyl-3-phosphoglycerate synthase